LVLGVKFGIIVELALPDSPTCPREDCLDLFAKIVFAIDKLFLPVGKIGAEEMFAGAELGGVLRAFFGGDVGFGIDPGFGGRAGFAGEIGGF
jgi:hypothetical protein